VVDTDLTKHRKHYLNYFPTVRKLDAFVPGIYVHTTIYFTLVQFVSNSQLGLTHLLV